MTIPTGRSGKASSVPLGLAMAAATSLGTTVIFSAAIAYCLNVEKINWTQAGYWIMGMLFTASFLGGKIACAAVRRQRLIVNLLSGILYWGILLLITALFFGGNYEAIWETAAVILSGNGCASMLNPEKHNHFKTKIKR